jgi:putative tricarboxylic transport membrane protein
MPGQTRRNFLKLAAVGGAIGASGLAAPSILRAQSYPSRPINIVVPFATGGYNDRLARAFAPFLQEAIGQPVNVVNRPGGNTIIGHQYALQQPPDGYTIMCTSAAPYIPLSIFLHNAPYTVDDFWMINLPSRDLTLAAAPADTQLEGFAQAIEMLQDDPTSLSLGVQPASADYLNLRLLLDANGIDADAVRLVTYDGGGPTRNAAAGGHVDIAFVGAEGFLPLIDQITPLLMFTDGPSGIFDDTQTVIDLGNELGFEGQYVEGSQRGWVVPTAFRDEHQADYDTLVAAIEQASTDDAAVQSLQDQQLATTWYGPEASNRSFRATFEVLAQHIDLLEG